MICVSESRLVDLFAYYSFYNHSRVAYILAPNGIIWESLMGESTSSSKDQWDCHYKRKIVKICILGWPLFIAVKNLLNIFYFRNPYFFRFTIIWKCTKYFANIKVNTCLNELKNEGEKFFWKFSQNIYICMIFFFIKLLNVFLKEHMKQKI